MSQVPSLRPILISHRFVSALLLPLLFHGSPSLAQTSSETLSQIFRDAPAAAKPMVRWWWFGPAVQKPEILRELTQMKADGIGGVELAFVYPEQLEGNLPFLSSPMLDAVTYAQTEARRLGLRVDVTLCSGWPYGGPHITLDQAATRLRTVEIPVPSNTQSIPVPKLAEGESFLSAAIVNGTPTPPPVRRAPQPATPPPSTWDPASAQPLRLANSSISVPTQPSSKPHVALFFIQSHTLQQVKRAAVGAEGYVLDPFSHEAVQNHLQSVGEPLLKAFGQTPPYAVFSDSLEAYGADWTPTLPAEFRKRRGYDLLPHLPELVAGGTPAAEKVRHDYGVTLTELVNENYLAQINQWATNHHTKFRSQTYGEPAVSFSSQNLAALPEGEGPQWRAFSTLRWATSANHVFGNTVTSGETFTWLHSPVFRATPLDMKAEADIDFLMGENQLIFHGWPYSPPASDLPKGDPGWSLYAAAVFNDHNPWHPVLPAVTQYITRISALLRQGQPANQVAILLPTDDAWASFSPGHVTVTGAMQKLLPPGLIPTILSAGYNFDFIDADAINSVGLGKYQVLVIPPTKRIPVKTWEEIANWSKIPSQNRGGKVICLSRCPSLDIEGKTLPDITSYFQLAQTPADLPHLLNDAAKPDLQLTGPNSTAIDQVGFVRRKSANADIYFVVNTRNRPFNAAATFSTLYAIGEQVNPDTGAALAIPAVNLSLNLQPYESRIFIFSKETESLVPSKFTYSYPSDFIPVQIGPLARPARLETSLADLSNNWRVAFPALNFSHLQTTLTDWLANPATAHFSGEAVYTREFTLSSLLKSSVVLDISGGTALPSYLDSAPEQPTLGRDGIPNPFITRTGPGMHAYYDPPIREAALVTLNGQLAGALWHPPYTLDVTKLLKPGKNHIEIHVFNTALNAWAAIPPRDYKPLIAKYGDRFQMQDLDKVQPLPSGILGTIQLIMGDQQ